MHLHVRLSSFFVFYPSICLCIAYFVIQTVDTRAQECMHDILVYFLLLCRYLIALRVGTFDTVGFHSSVKFYNY